MGKLRALAVIALAQACGGPKSPAKPAPVASTTKQFQPLGIKDDAKAPNQAVILGTDEKNGSTVIKLPAVETRDTVDAMFVRMGGGQPPVGGSSPVKLASGPNADRTVEVGIFEDVAGGAGPQWRAGVWVAAITAANILGKDLTDFRFSASSGGYIDGASASGLMTAGFLATMTGAKVDPTATMTGIINPDGTIGPVAGIPEKFKGSLERGKKRLGYPLGMRWARSEATHEMVDLAAIAKEGHGEAVEIATVYDAYKLLTGKPLPEPVPVAAKDMALDDSTVKALDAKYAEWQKRYGEELSALLQLQQAGRLPATIHAMAQLALKNAEKADKLHKQGNAAAAYRKMLDAWVFAASATDTYDILVKVQKGDVDGAIKHLSKLDNLEERTVEVFKKIGEMKPATMGGHLLMLGAYQSALRGWGFKQFASESIVATKKVLLALANKDEYELRSAETADQIVQSVSPTIYLIGLTVAETLLAKERLEFESEKSINYMCNLPNVKRMASSFQSAGAAGINYFETLILQSVAEAGNVTLDEARNKFAVREPNYLVAWVLSKLPQTNTGVMAELKGLWGEKSLQWNLMALAGSQLAYTKSSELVAKYYSLGIKTDAIGGKVQSVEHEKAFMTMLAYAEHTARANARAARIATGAIPVQAKLAYQLATVQREGDTQDKIDALASYWTSSEFSQTAVALARN